MSFWNFYDISQFLKLLSIFYRAPLNCPLTEYVMLCFINSCSTEKTIHNVITDEALWSNQTQLSILLSFFSWVSDVSETKLFFLQKMHRCDCESSRDPGFNNISPKAKRCLSTEGHQCVAMLGKNSQEVPGAYFPRTFMVQTTLTVCHTSFHRLIATDLFIFHVYQFSKTKSNWNSFSRTFRRVVESIILSEVYTFY